MATGIRAANPIWFFNDLVGQPLNDQFYISFLTNTFPYLPQPVFQDVNLTVPWSNPLEFGPNGGLPDNMYWDPSLVWRLEIRQGPTQSDPLIYEINNFMPGQGGNIIPSSTGLLTQENQITNPQFAQVNFTGNYVITTAGTYNVAPGWNLILTGAGSTTLTQLILAGTTIVDPNNNSIPYALKINNSGWTTAILQQTFNHNGALWAGGLVGNGGAVGGLLVGRSDIANQTITMQYAPSLNPPIPSTILTAALTTGNFAIFSGVLNIPASANSQTSDVAYTNININLPPSGTVELSDIQVTGQNTPFTSNQLPTLQEETIERGIDHEFHVYNPQLRYKPIPSLLVGWDFPLNPAQFGATVGPIASGANSSFYAWDQTIIFQTVTNGVTVTKGDGGELFLTASATSQMAIIQYLAVPQATSVLNDAIAAHIAAIVTGVPLGATISLWYTKDVSLPSTVVSHQSLVATLDANGTPLTFHGNWLPVPRLPNQPASFTIDVINTTNFNDYDFNGWNLNGIADVNLATYFAIVIGTASVTSGNTLRIGSVGLCHGMIATRPGAQTADEVLRECQYYYEQSYLNGSPPSATFVGSTIVPVSLTEGSPSDTLSTRSFTLTYKEVKIRFIVPTFYSPATGSINHIVAAINTAGTGEATVDVPISNWTAISNTPSSYSLQATTGGSVIGALTSINNEGLNIFQYIADARLGI